MGVDLHLLHPDASVQHILVVLFHTDLADVVGVPIVGRVDLLQLVHIDAPHVAKDMRAKRPQRIMTAQSRFDVYPWKLLPVDGETGHLLLGQVEPQGHAFEPRRPGQHPVEALDVVVADGDQVPQAFYGCGEIVHLFRNHLQLERRQVLGEQHPVAVVNETPSGR